MFKSSVCLKIRRVTERPATCLTDEGFLSSVDPLMLLLLHVGWVFYSLSCLSRLCALRFDGSLNAQPHASQMKGFSPVWTLLCRSKWGFHVNALKHTSQTYGFSPEWLFICRVKFGLWLNVLEHRSQLNLGWHAFVIEGIDIGLKKMEPNWSFAPCTVMSSSSEIIKTNTLSFEHLSYQISLCSKSTCMVDRPLSNVNCLNCRVLVHQFWGTLLMQNIQILAIYLHNYEQCDHIYFEVQMGNWVCSITMGVVLQWVWYYYGSSITMDVLLLWVVLLWV